MGEKFFLKHAAQVCSKNVTRLPIRLIKRVVTITCNLKDLIIFHYHVGHCVISLKHMIFIFSHVSLLFKRKKRAVDDA